MVQVFVCIISIEKSRTQKSHFLIQICGPSSSNKSSRELFRLSVALKNQQTQGEYCFQTECNLTCDQPGDAAKHGQHLTGFSQRKHKVVQSLKYFI